METYYYIFTLVFISFVFIRSDVKIQKVIMLFWVLFFTLFGGLRWEIGGDWKQYYFHFLNSSWNNIFNYDRYGNGVETLEPGFVFLNVLIKTLFDKFWIYNLIICLIIQLSNYKFSIYFFPKYPLLCHCTLLIMANYIFPVRSGLSLGICIWAYIYLKQRKILKYALVVAIASLIHYQQLILLPLYFLQYVKLKGKYLIIIFISIILLSFVLKKYVVALSLLFSGELGNKMYNYTQEETLGFLGPSYIGWALNAFFLIIYINIRSRFSLQKDCWYNALINIFIIYNAIFIIFSGGMGDLARLSSSLLPAQCLLLVDAFVKMSRDKVFLVRILSFIFFFSYMLYKIPTIWSGTYFKYNSVPYKTIFTDR